MIVRRLEKGYFEIFPTNRKFMQRQTCLILRDKKSILKLRRMDKERPLRDNCALFPVHLPSL